MNWKETGISIRCAAAQRGHRFLVVLSGEMAWTSETAKLLISQTPHIWISDSNITDSIPASRASDILGQETGTVVYDAHESVNPDALGIVSGAIRAGEMLILLMPHPETWTERMEARTNSWYLYRLAKQIQSITADQKQNGAFFFSSNAPSEYVVTFLTNHKKKLPLTLPTIDQHQAIDQITAVVEGQRRRPTVLIADRGRGKSASMGIAAKKLLATCNGKIIVTATSRASCQNIFLHTEDTDGAATNARIVWRTVADLLEQQEECLILLIDEAAGIPIPQLENLILRYPRIAMSTTVHGYEGTGRGFILRFQNFLDSNTRGWRRCTLQTPVRWAPDDPLERHTNHLLVLDAALTNIDKSIANVKAASSAPEVIHIDKQQLASNESLLRDLFSLLVLAHYKTRPRDILQLLDNSKLNVYALVSSSDAKSIIAVALVLDESDLSETLQNEIYLGQRRPPGYMLPEILLGQLGVSPKTRLNTARIMRIVVHPDLQGKGYGSVFLQQLHLKLAPKFDLCGVNFALSAQLVRFWRNNGYHPIRIGVTSGKESGAPSGMLLRALNGSMEQSVDSVRSQFSRNLGSQLMTTLKHLDPAIVYSILINNPDFSDMLSNEQMSELSSYCKTSRPAESILATLSAALVHAIATGYPSPNCTLLIERVLQFRSWQHCSALSGAEGKAEGNRRLKSDFREIANRLADESTKNSRRN